jgi:hypothetical protein
MTLLFHRSALGAPTTLASLDHAIREHGAPLVGVLREYDGPLCWAFVDDAGERAASVASAVAESLSLPVEVRTVLIEMHAERGSVHWKLVPRSATIDTGAGAVTWQRHPLFREEEGTDGSEPIEALTARGGSLAERWIAGQISGRILRREQRLRSAAAPAELSARAPTRRDQKL